MIHTTQENIAVMKEKRRKEWYFFCFIKIVILWELQFLSIVYRNRKILLHFLVSTLWNTISIVVWYREVWSHDVCSILDFDCQLACTIRTLNRYSFSDYLDFNQKAEKGIFFIIVMYYKSCCPSFLDNSLWTHKKTYILDP